MKIGNLVPSESRMASPVLLRLSETDRKQLKILARKTKIPMATLAYHAVRNMLDEQFGKDGAQ